MATKVHRLLVTATSPCSILLIALTPEVDPMDNLVTIGTKKYNKINVVFELKYKFGLGYSAATSDLKKDGVLYFCIWWRKNNNFGINRLIGTVKEFNSISFFKHLYRNKR